MCRQLLHVALQPFSQPFDSGKDPSLIRWLQTAHILESAAGRRQGSVVVVVARPDAGGDERPSERLREVMLGSFRRRSPPEIRADGYVVHTLEAALWAFDRGGSFAEGVLLAVNLGDDADTVAAVYGQLAGAYYGVGGIPERWLRVLAEREVIEGMAEGLLRRAEGLILDSSGRP